MVQQIRDVCKLVFFCSKVLDSTLQTFFTTSLFDLLSLWVTSKDDKSNVYDVRYVSLTVKKNRLYQIKWIRFVSIRSVAYSSVLQNTAGIIKISCLADQLKSKTQICTIQPSSSADSAYLRSTARFWNCTHWRAKKSQTAERQQKEAKCRQRDAPNTHCLQRGSSDKLLDSNRHDGWSSRAEWCPWCTIYLSQPVPICLHAVSQTKSLSI